MLKQYEAACNLEAFLGEPEDVLNTWSFQSSMEWDEREEFPQGALDRLRAFGINKYYTPVAYGGKLASYEEFLALSRSVARRDLTAAITYSTFIWSTLVWIGGTENQKCRQARYIEENSEAFCLAYSEEMHGSDLIASELRAVAVDEEYSLSGEKWPINRATRSGAIVLLARTRENRGSRGLSLFLLYKSDLDPGRFSHLPRVKTLGLRGCDISGLRFEECRVPACNRIGEEGHGLELALKAFQVTRTLCAGLSLGATDTALRITLDFALRRKLYGANVFTIPHVHNVLANAFADLLICECMAIASARGLHVVTEQFSTWSAVVKYFVPTTLEQTVQNLAVVLGARYYMREKHYFGVFQKILRDNAIVSLFDGSTVVNLHALAGQLTYLARNLSRKDRAYSDLVLHERLQTIFDLRHDLPVFDGRRLDLFGRGQDAVMQGLALALDRLHILKSNNPHDNVLHQLLLLADAFRQELYVCCDRIEEHPASIKDSRSVTSFELARQYCLLHAAATCLQFWLHNRDKLDGFFQRGEWLAFCLNRLLQQLRPFHCKETPHYGNKMADRLSDLFYSGQLLSLIPIPLTKAVKQQQEIHYHAAR